MMSCELFDLNRPQHWTDGIFELLFSVQEEEGWLRGRLREKTGVFPSNFVRLSATESDGPKCEIFCLLVFQFSRSQKYVR